MIALASLIQRRYRLFSGYFVGIYRIMARMDVPAANPP
jgi:hypothetical protein